MKSLIIAVALVLWASSALGETCDDHPEGAPPKSFLDMVRWDIGFGAARSKSSTGTLVEISAEKILHPHFELGLQVFHSMMDGSQSVEFLLSGRLFPFIKWGGTGANVCGMKGRHWRHEGAPYLALGGGLGASDGSEGVALAGRVAIGWDQTADRFRSVFVEFGYQHDSGSNGGFGLVGFRF